MTTPPLRNDCFALPPGVDWTPVDEALDHLRQAVTAVTPVVGVPVAEAHGLFLASDVIARRAHPPVANSAVDGYGFAAAALGEGPQSLPLHPGRAAAGTPFDGTVPPGAALRTLTGAAVPPGVDTVVLQEDVKVDGDHIAFSGKIKPGSNTRKAGEDVESGAVVLPKGRRAMPQDLGLMRAVGIDHVDVHRRLRVGVLSTGDELVDAGAAAPHQIYDANRPMLLALLHQFGHQPVDLGHVGDDRDALRARLDTAGGQVDAILTSGGASAGEEDHLSALLNDTGTMQMWRIAVKPGRPLALGLWDGVPVFGLPGNPVAAYVCSLIFAEPTLRVLAGGDWRVLRGVSVPAAFQKSKKAGRREYLRARLNANGMAEVFQSEGSGRISGLSWADGLVELPDPAMEVEPRQMVRFLPFAAFGAD